MGDSPSLFETLLYKHEGEELDFKRDQYPFEKATPEQKSELVKDIVAFANAWKTCDAHILIGVEEVKGGRAKVVGVSHHIDDAKIQQLVNSKTSTQVRFAYLAEEIDGKPVGVLRIERDQDRPIVLKNNFGKLTKDMVYIRRGSSTDTAKPDEIARMGAAQATGHVAVPSIDLGFGKAREREYLGTSLEAFPTVFVDPPPPTSQELAEMMRLMRESGFIQQLSANEIQPASFVTLCRSPKPSPEELRAYRQDVALLVAIGFCVK